MISEKKVQFRIQLPESDTAKLDAVGHAAGRMTGNAFATVALAELASLAHWDPRANKGQGGYVADSGQVYACLGRIAEEVKAAQPPAPELPEARRRVQSGTQHALPV